LMRHLLNLMTDCVRRQGGTVKSFTGDGMALFGVPVAFELPTGAPPTLGR
jgi:class 3 adenylate cyclase